MPTTTSRLVISSTDLLSSTLSIDATATLTQAGGSTAIAETSGLGVTKNVGDTNQYTLYAQASYTDDKAHKIYLRNASSTAAEYVVIAIASQELGRLYAGDVALIPWNGNADFKITPSANNISLEHAIFYE
tara:strand:- start:40 stop:432 length:393 start_codon:yes stop_codon:yes gene_type:complete